MRVVRDVSGGHTGDTGIRFIGHISNIVTLGWWKQIFAICQEKMDSSWNVSISEFRSILIKIIVVFANEKFLQMTDKL